jgi:Rrf2 family protein
VISRQASHALKALLELAREQERWRSSRELASAQQLPEPMLEQLLLRLRRGGVLVARRGRLGGYRLARESSRITVAEVLAGLGEAAGNSTGRSPRPGGVQLDAARACPPADRVTEALRLRLERARQQTLEELTLEELMFDLRSAEAGAGDGGGLLLG